MQDINKRRAELIFNQYGSGECSIVVTDIFKRFLTDFPSLVKPEHANEKDAQKTLNMICQYLD